MQEFLSNGEVDVTVVGGGYVGLPLAVELARSGCDVMVYDLDLAKVQGINLGKSHVPDVSDEDLRLFTTRWSEVRERTVICATHLPEVAFSESTDVVLICVPTPLQGSRDPDISFVEQALAHLQPRLHKHMLVVLESTVYPGFTREVMAPQLAAQDDFRHREELVLGRDLFVAFSPERVDPGNKRWTIANTPKVVGGVTARCTAMAAAFYSRILKDAPVRADAQEYLDGGVNGYGVVPVSSPDVAEMVKLLENTYRAVNIALVNELARACNHLDVDVWEVVGAAATKPFGFERFTPGPGVGGHCIGPDPQYLAWKLRNIRHASRFIELAAEVNMTQPAYVVSRLRDELNTCGVALKGTRVLIVGVAYKPEVSDTRESPALDIMAQLRELGADVCYLDPFVDAVEGFEAASKDMLLLKDAFDAAVIVTDHSLLYVDYEGLLGAVPLVLDTRDIIRRGGFEGTAKVVPL